MWLRCFLIYCHLWNMTLLTASGYYEKLQQNCDWLFRAFMNQLRSVAILNDAPLILTDFAVCRKAALGPAPAVLFLFITDFSEGFSNNRTQACFVCLSFDLIKMINPTVVIYESSVCADWFQFECKLTSIALSYTVGLRQIIVLLTGFVRVLEILEKAWILM